MKTITNTQFRRLTILTIILLMVLFAQEVSAQSYKVVGNEIVSIKTAKTKTEPTATIYTYKGNIVYKGSKGGFFVYMTSKKTGKEYKKYLKID